MKDEFVLIKNVTENLYAEDKRETSLSTRHEPIPTVIQAFDGHVKSFYVGSKGLVVTEHDTVAEAVKLVTDLFGVYSPIIRFVKGATLTPSNGNGHIEERK